MNTSDQNVFTLDTAFKRRWNSEKLTNTFDDKHTFSQYLVPGMHGVTWKGFVERINENILKDNDLLASEDKQLGIYFVSKAMLLDPTVSYDENSEEVKTITKAFAYKVFEYLWNDVTKFSREKWFESEIRSLDKLIDAFTKGKQVFRNDIFPQ